MKNEYTDENKKWHQKIEKISDAYVHTNKNPQSILNRPFTTQEILHVINGSNRNTAMGVDKIHAKLIYFAEHQLAPYLVKLWNYIYIVHSESPIIWKFTDIFPVPKPGRDNSITKNNRPISLLPVLARLFEKALSNRIITWCLKNNIIKSWNCAFQPNKSTEDIVGAISQNILRNFDKKSMTEVTFMDLESAYDTVWQKGLYYKLTHIYKIDGNFVAFLRSYFLNRYNRVTFGNFSTKWTVHNQGLPQGGPLMPIIWTLFINDYVISKYNKNHVELAAFADDLTMYVLPENYTAKSIVRLQHEIDHLYNYTRNWKLVINAAKCSTISFTRKEKLKAHVYNIENIPLDCVHHPHNAPDICTHSKNPKHKQIAKQHQTKQDANFNDVPTNKDILTPSPCRMKVDDPHNIPLWVRILGLYFDCKLTWQQHTNHIINRVKQKLYQLRRITHCKRFNLSPRVVWKLYISTIRPIIEYGLAIL